MTYMRLLADRGFLSFLWTQFLAAFNDNVFKILVSIVAVHFAADPKVGDRYLALAGAVFVLPFLLFSGWAGELADRYSKSQVLIYTKALEILTMLLALAALTTHSVEAMLAVLFLLATQATFFSPAKYAIVPEIVPHSGISKANALLELSTFAAIVLGTAGGTALFEHWKAEPARMGLAMIGVAIVGSLVSLGITATRPVNGAGRLRLNPFAETLAGFRVLARHRDMGWAVAGISYFWMVGGLFQMDLLLFGAERLHVTDLQSGIMVAMLAVGIGAGSILAGWISGDGIVLGLVPPAAVALGLSAIAVSGAVTYPGAIALLIVMGVAAGLFIVPLNAMLQERAPAAEKGRVLAANNFANMVGVILASGFLTGLREGLGLSAAQVMYAAGVATLFGAVICVWKMPSEMLRLFLHGLLKMVVRIKVVGKLPASGPALIASNHVSFLDAFIIGSVTDRWIRFLLWKPYYEHPKMKRFAKLLYCLPMAQEGLREIISNLKAANAVLTEGEMVGIFPEGSITRTGAMEPFRRGYEKILQGNNAPIVPVHLSGLWRHPASPSGVSWWPWRRWDVTISIGEPMPASTTPEELQQRVMEIAGETIGDRFLRVARRAWKEPAVLDSTGKKLTFGEWTTAAVLMRKRLGTETHVGVMLPTSVGGAVVNMGALLAGRVVVNLNWTSGEEAVRSAVRQCGIRTVITSKAFAEKVELPKVDGLVYLEDLLGGIGKAEKLWAYIRAKHFVRAAGDPGDTAAVIFSSGSTGEPKGVMLSHRNLLANVEGAAQVFPVGAEDCMMGVLPLFHSFGLTYNLIFPMAMGFRTVLHPNPMDGARIGELAGENGATFLLSTPTFCLGYLRKCKPEQFSKLRYVVVGAEKLRPALAESFAKRFGVEMREGYGCTEMGPVVAVNGPNAARLGTVGRLLPGVSARLVDPESFAPVATGEEGLLLVKGPSRMKGYIGQPERTAAALREDFYITGDLARFDEEGFLMITDRLSRFSKIGGEMVPHGRVEEVVEDVVGAGQCVVVGIPDETKGERLVVLYSNPDVAPAAIIEAMREKGLPPLWIPKRDAVLLVDAVPTLGTGKKDLGRAKKLALERVTIAAGA